MILDAFRLYGKVAIVTGSGRGIGRGIALALAELGADVVCCARSESAIESVTAEVRALGRKGLAVRCDVTERADLDALVTRTLGELGRVDILVNNAGGAPPRSALRTSERAFEEAFRFNVTSAFLLSRLVAPKMLESGGVILNVSSAISHLVDKGFIAYGTAKAALNHMTRLLAHELAPKVRVNAIAVGAVETDALAPFVADPNLRAKMEALTPLGRVGTVRDVAIAASFLASPASSWVTGKVLEVDGGTVASNWPIDLSDL